MHLVWRLITPFTSSPSFASSFTNGIYGQIWAVLSLSHIASISPVITYVSGLPSMISKSTVVSNVFGKQFSNNQASSGFAICFLMRTIAASIASLVNFRSANGGRLLTKSFIGKLKILVSEAKTSD